MELHIGHIITPHSSLNADGNSWVDLPRGIVATENGRIAAVAKSLASLDPAIKDAASSVFDHGESFIMPGFIDTHVHYPQLEIISSPGMQLLEWLNTYTFPAEAKYADYGYARGCADFFTDQLIANGITTAAVFATVHTCSVEALFQSSFERNLRILSGKIFMDTNAPECLLEESASAIDDATMLIERWHKKGRLEYAITPRFAPTSSPHQLSAIGELVEENPDLLLQTHLSENVDECQWVDQLFPQSRDYLDVYDQSGLVYDRSLFAHSIHLDERQRDVLRTNKSAISHCPTSNFFLGSGVFDRGKHNGITTGLGSDVGAGTSLCPLSSLRAAYEAGRLNGCAPTTPQMLQLATLDGARALGVEDKVGSIEVGKDADLVILDPQSSAMLRYRVDQAKSTEEVVFAMFMLGDERTIAHTVVAGEVAHSQPLLAAN